MARFKIGSRQFSLALSKLQESREIKLILGVETFLLHVSDNDAEFIVIEWRRLQGQKEDNGPLVLDYFSADRFYQTRKSVENKNKIVTGISDRLSVDSIADIEAIFYLAREKHFTEHYDDLVGKFKKENHGTAEQRVSHLIEKTNFADTFIRGISQLGRPSLAKSLEAE